MDHLFVIFRELLLAEELAKIVLSLEPSCLPKVSARAGAVHWMSFEILEQQPHITVMSNAHEEFFCELAKLQEGDTRMGLG
jgi:hypothetical protein